MQNKSLIATLGVLLGLTGAAVVGGLTDGTSDKPVTTVAPRLAVSTGVDCPPEWKCGTTVVRDGRCFCLTDKASLAGEEASPSDETLGLAKQMRVCKKNGDYRIDFVSPESALPSDSFCRVVIEKTLIKNTFKGIQTEVENTLAARCGLPVTSHTWYCCPQCLLFDDGCPPCPELCPYWEKWKGHEAECSKILP